MLELTAEKERRADCSQQTEEMVGREEKQQRSRPNAASRQDFMLGSANGKFDAQSLVRRADH